MCGIFAASLAVPGFLSLDRVVEAIRHRGPDDTGTFVASAGDCQLAHTRLSILDLSAAGHQPMADAQGRHVLTYNGEIYNFMELRQGLEAKFGRIAWKGTSDSEVIVEGFAREGASFLGRLNGIFALAIYDTHDRVLHVLRDPVGIKPLFVTEQSGNAYFCSELKGLQRLPGVRMTMSRGALADQLAYMYVPEPFTLFDEVRKLEPGTCFTYRAGRLVSKISLFAHLEEVPPLRSEADAVEALQASFSAAVRRQLVSDVPVSLFLSGGLDSSAVAQEVIGAGATVRDAYTIAFSAEDRRLDAQSDDLHFARLMADRLRLDLKVIPAHAGFLDMLPQLMPHMEDGFSDPAALNTYIICAAARKDGIKVMLSGQGADEYLGGYRRYVAERGLRRVPAVARHALGYAANLFPATLPGRWNALNRRIKRLGSIATQSPDQRVKSLYTWTTPGTVRQLLGDVTPASGRMFEQILSETAGDDVVAAMMKVDRHFDLMSLNLCYTDRMSMAVGVEVRVPFLDFDLIRTMNAIPSSLKVKGMQGKYVFKKAMEQALPREVVYREKAGFGLPMRAWMRKDHPLLRHYLDPERISRQGIFRPDAVRQLVDEQFAGIRDHSNTVFTLLTQQLWLEANELA